jgi:hypothetical protein
MYINLGKVRVWVVCTTVYRGASNAEYFDTNLSALSCKSKCESRRPPSATIRITRRKWKGSHRLMIPAPAAEIDQVPRTMILFSDPSCKLGTWLLE